MMNQKLLILTISVFSILFLGLSPAFAQNVKESSTGVEFPAQTNAAGKPVAITGTGVRKKFGFKVYAIASYLEAGKLDKSRDPYSQLLTDGPTKLIVMHFVRSVDAGKIRETFLEGLEKNIPNYKGSPARKDAEAFLNAMTDVGEGDKIELTWSQGGKLNVKIKGQSRGDFQNPLLAQAVWGIWLGGSPISSDIKNGLVANAR
jgi:hypothetical protein